MSYVMSTHTRIFWKSHTVCSDAPFPTGVFVIHSQMAMSQSSVVALFQRDAATQLCHVSTHRITYYFLLHFRRINGLITGDQTRRRENTEKKQRKTKGAFTPGLFFFVLKNKETFTWFQAEHIKAILLQLLCRLYSHCKWTAPGFEWNRANKWLRKQRRNTSMLQNISDRIRFKST